MFELDLTIPTINLGIILYFKTNILFKKCLFRDIINNHGVHVITLETQKYFSNVFIILIMK